MNTNSTKRVVFSNFLWRFAERTGAQIVQFIVSIVLARVLLPEAYGTVALMTVFIQILQVFVDSGLGNALIQKKNADNIDFSTVFYTNIAFCLILYALLFLASPIIAYFYEDPALTAYTRVLGLTVIISGVKNVQQAYVSRKLLFRRFFFATLTGTLTAAVVGIALAYSGAGVWALIAQQITNLLVDTVMLWITVKWRPDRVFSKERLKGLFSYGSKLLISAIIDTVYNNVRQLIIGKLYTKKDLAYYNQGKQFPNVVVTNINTSIDSVLLSVMSKEQDHRESVKQMTRRAIKTSTYIMAPLMMGLAFCGDTVIELLLTEKWLSAVPFMRIFCITYMFYPVHTANLNAIKAMGRSDLFLKLEIIKKAVGLAVMLTTMWFGVMMMAYSLLFTSIVSQIINSWPNKKLLGYSYFEQLKDLLPGILLAVFMGICVMLIGYIPNLPLIVTLVLQIAVGGAIYILLSKLLKLESFEYMLELIKDFVSGKKGKEENDI